MVYSLKKSSSGFTLIELLVSISILTLVMAVMFFSYRIFNHRLLVASVSQEIALTAQQAQTYGLSTKEATVGGGDFKTGFGVAFNLATPKTFTLFADKNANGKYDPATELIEAHA